MTIRLLEYKPATAADNMAIDEAILEAHLQGLVPPTLRLYSFEPATVSLGYAQDLPSETIDAIGRRGFDLVRRPTGGRAVLHASELTYSFVCMSTGADRSMCDSSAGLPANAGAPAATSTLAEPLLLSASVATAYKQICRGLLKAMQNLGLELELGASNAAYRGMDDCFMAVTSADLHFRGKKMIGSAQLRRKGAILQHGSILLDQDQNLMGSITGSEVQAQQAQHHANLFEALGRRVSCEELQSALKAGFESAFERELVAAPLTKDELAIAEELRPKYLKLER
ncbi:MAG TPA: lipoate--protein ligase family protein [Chroococcales cyanobacterium]